MSHCLFPRILIVFLAGFLAAGCVTTKTERRSQTLNANTTPPGAQVWVGDEAGQRVAGKSPLSFEQDYKVSRKDFNEWWWALPAGSVVLAGIGYGLSSVDDTSGENGTEITTGLSILITAGVGLIATSIMCIIGQLKDGEFVHGTEISIGANLDGYQPKEMKLQLPTDQEEINLLLPKVHAPSVAAVPDSAPTKGPNPERAIVAVFDINDASRKLDKDVLVQLTGYLGTVMAETGKYQVVPRDQLRQRLLDEKKGTYKSCYDESCQIELGKSLAAQ